MTTFADLILSAEVEQDQAIRRREKALEAVKLTYTRAKNEGRSDLTPDEDAEVRASMEMHTRADADVTGVGKKLAHLKAAKAAEEMADRSLAEIRENPRTAPAKLPAYDAVTRVGREERTYHPGNCRQGGNFLRDVARQFLFRDPESEARIVRHMREERIERPELQERAAGDAGTSAFTGLVVPQYLTELYAPKMRARRPFADACNRHDLPASGMTVNISQITTGSTAALQASQFDAVSATSMDDTLLTENVQTAAGQQSLSRQAIERGTGIEDVTMDDLQRALATNLDSNLINDATTGLAALGVAVAYTDTTPTGPELYPKLLGAMAGVEAVLLGLAAPDIAVMHSRRWYWLQAQMTTSWPMFGQPGIGNVNSGENLAQRYGAGFRGILPCGVVVITDNNCPTTIGAGTEDEIYVAASDECHLWEDPNAPQFIRAEQPKAANLAVTFVLYEYYAYTFRRFASSIGRISGTGLIAPVF